MSVLGLLSLAEPLGQAGGPDALGAVRALFATGAVLGLIGVIAWLVRRGALVLPGRRGRSPLAVETALPLGERRSLVIVTVEGRRLLLGLTPASVSLVTELAVAAPRFDEAVERRLEAEAGGGA
jgi:flagellar biosynthetic protein FliO